MPHKIHDETHQMHKLNEKRIGKYQTIKIMNFSLIVRRAAQMAQTAMYEC